MEKTILKKENFIFSKKFTTIFFIIVSIFCIMLFSYCFTQKSFQNDTFYAIKIGELISQNGIDMKDHFSNTENLPYTYPHWLFDFIIYNVYHLFGNSFFSLYILTIFLTNVLAFSFFYICYKKSESKIFSLSFTLLLLFALRDFLALRAQIVTYTLFIWAYYFIDNIATKKDFKIYNSIGLVLISILVANMHCATWPFLFLIFMPYFANNIVVFLFSHKYTQLEMLSVIKVINFKIQKINNKIKKSNDKEKYLDDLKKLTLKKEKLEAKLKEINKELGTSIFNLDKMSKFQMMYIYNAKQLFITFVVCVLAGFLTPLGLVPFTYLATTFAGTTTNFITEHSPFVPFNSKYITLLLFVIIIVIAFAKSKFSISDLCMLGGMTILLLSSNRNQSLFVLFSLIIFAKILTKLLKNVNWFVSNKTYILYIVMILSIILSIFCYTSFNKKLIHTQIVSKSEYPIDATNYILNNLDYKNIKLYNEYNFGSYLLFNDIPVFIDSRADLYDSKFNKLDYNIFEDFIDVSNIHVWYDEIFEKYGFTHFIMSNDNVLCKVISKLDNRFLTLYHDDYFTVFEKIN